MNMPHRKAAGMPVTTTHAGWGAGMPQLIVSGPERFVHDLKDEVTTIGSDPGNTVVLAGASERHAQIVHDDRDEFVLTMFAPGAMNTRPHTAGTHPAEFTETLRTGARFTTGEWTLVFTREEFADHGRPWGGRQGGEGSAQRRQPARPDYSHHDAAQDELASGSDKPDGRPLEPPID